MYIQNQLCVIFMQESEALELYNKALQFQQLGNHESAKEFYEKLLSASFVADVSTLHIIYAFF